jgi:hypothetical protein
VWEVLITSSSEAIFRLIWREYDLNPIFSQEGGANEKRTDLRLQSKTLRSGDEGTEIFLLALRQAGAGGYADPRQKQGR